MTLVDLPLDYIQNHGTQVREKLDEAVVANYAERMEAGDVFPPGSACYDGSEYNLWDGFHRREASLQLGRTTMPVEVTPGGREQALWLALGANRTNAHRRSEGDVRHACEVAILQFPNRSTAQLADQIGCSQRYLAAIKDQVRATTTLPDHVIGRDGRQYPASRPKRAASVHPKHDAIVKAVQAGQESQTIQRELQVRAEAVATVRRELTGRQAMTREKVQARHEQIRTLAAGAYTTRQIAAAVGLSYDGCRGVMHKLGIDAPADRVMGKTKRLSANRITDTIVMDAANLTAGVELIDFATLDRSRIPEWLESLHASREKLGGLIRRLMKEQQHEVA